MVYYPIGTVVILEGGNRPLMIYGRKQIQATTGQEWDYVGCLYPEGNLGDEYTVFFQQEEIAQVLHAGWMSEYDMRMQLLLDQISKEGRAG